MCGSAAIDFSSWTDEELELGEQIATVALCKALALGDEYTQLAFAELRLREKLSRTHTKIAKGADRRYVREVRAASRINSEWIQSHVGKYVKNWNGWADDNEKSVIEVTKLAYITGKTAIYRRAFGAKERPIYNGPPYEQRAPVAEIPVSVEKAVSSAINPHTTLTDARAIEQIVKGQMFWIGKYHNDVLRKQIEQVTREILLEQGLPRGEAARRLAAELGYNNGYLPVKPVAPIPTGWKGSTKQYFDGVAANAATVSRIHSSITAIYELGFDVYEVLNPIDERTCPICDTMSGAVLDVRQAYQHMQEVIGAANPEQVKIDHPWLSVSDFISRIPQFQVQPDGSKVFSESGVRSIITSGTGYPPYHFKCRCSVDVRPDSVVRPVTVPADVDMPRGVNPIKPIRPEKYAHPTIKGPTAPVVFDEIALRKGLSSYFGGNTSASTQATIRRQLNSLLYEEGGMIPHDIVYKKPDLSKFGTFVRSDNISGMHSFSGEIKVSETRMKGAIRFIRKGSKASVFDLNDFRVFVHEAVHGTSPIASSAYRGIGIFIEEISTEAITRHVLVRRYGFKWNQIIGYDVLMDRAEKAVDIAWKNVAKKIKLKPKSLLKKRINEFMAKAAIKMRNHIVFKPTRSQQVLLDKYVERLADEFTAKAFDSGLFGEALTNFHKSAKRELIRQFKEAWKDLL